MFLLHTLVWPSLFSEGSHLTNKTSFQTQGNSLIYVWHLLFYSWHGIKLGIGLMLDVKLGIGDSPEVGFGNGSPLGFELGIDAVCEDGFEDGSSLDVKLGLGRRSVHRRHSFLVI
jgi:hypothetical protein